MRYLCQGAGIAVLEVVVWGGVYKNERVFHETWSCTPHIRGTLHKNVVVALPPDLAYRPSVLNPVTNHVHKTLIRVFLLDEKAARRRLTSDAYEPARTKFTYRVKVV